MKKAQQSMQGRWQIGIRKSNLKSTTKLLLLSLSTRMDPDGSNLYPTLETICEDTGLTKHTVLAHTKEAKKYKWLEVKSVKVKGRAWNRNQYIPKMGTDRNSPIKRVNNLRRGAIDLSTSKKRRSAIDTPDAVQSLTHYQYITKVKHPSPQKAACSTAPSREEIFPQDDNIRYVSAGDF